MRFAYVFLLTMAVVAPRGLGQERVNQQLYQCVLLEQQGNFTPAIHTLQSITGSDVLSRVDRGRAWTLLGFAYKETGQFQLSESAFEKALSILEGDTQHLADLANVLDFSANLYQMIGQPQIAAKMWSKALAIDKQQADHRGLVKTYANLAAAALEQKHMRVAKAFFNQAIAEPATDLTDDDRAFLSDIQGWIDEKTGHVPEEVSDYERALDLWKRNHGEQHPITGWRYLLLGNAYAANGELAHAVAVMRQGLTILEHTAGSQNPRYLSGEIMYARVLKKYGKHTEAAQLKAEAEQQFRELYQGQCIGCTVSAWSFR
jgi:tetratricopeptide (TPR) repeat protein